jgi:hypothetical protein
MAAPGTIDDPRGAVEKANYTWSQSASMRTYLHALKEVHTIANNVHPASRWSALLGVHVH